MENALINISVPAQGETQMASFNDSKNIMAT